MKTSDLPLERRLSTICSEENELLHLRVIEGYRNIRSLWKVAKLWEMKGYATTHESIRRILHKHKAQIEKRGSRKKVYSEEEIQAWIQLYKGGLSAVEIAKRYGRNPTKVLLELKIRKVKLRTRWYYAIASVKGKRKLTQEEREEIASSYEAETPVGKICRIYDITSRTLYKYLDELRVKRRNPRKNKIYAD